MKFSIVVPCYNEEKNLRKLVEKFDAFDKEKYPIELILVNNGSTDDSATIMEELKANYSFVKISTVTVNQGYGYGILAGLQEASGEYLGWIHADLQFEPNEIEKAIDYLKQNNYPKNIFIKGRRRNRPIVDTIFTMGMGVYESLLLGQKLWDINAQPIVFSRDLYEKWDNPPYDFSLDLYAYYTASIYKYRVWRFDVIQHDRVEGESSWNDGMSARIKLTKRVLGYSAKLKQEFQKNCN